jgi:23S rRNA pseudouridine1911/1915/1917 synthase
MEIHDAAESEPRVLYEDESLVAVRKPPRMHSAPGLGGGGLCAWVFERYPEIREAGGRGRESPGEGGLLHRLDYDTSGLVLFARRAEAFEELLRQQRSGRFLKDYLAFCSPSRNASPAGSIPPLAAPGGVGEEAWNRARASLDAEALAALLGPLRVTSGPGSPPVLSSAFRPFGPRGAKVACLAGPEAERGKPLYETLLLGCAPNAPRGSLRLRARLARGFRHQVRAQLAWVGLPIRGDALYGGEPDSRLRLYAVRLAFSHPLSGAPVELSDE